MDFTICLHFAETPGGEKPFAILLSVGEEGKDGKIHHYPLAKSKYKNQVMAILDHASDEYPTIALMRQRGINGPVPMSANEANWFLRTMWWGIFETRIPEKFQNLNEVSPEIEMGLDIEEDKPSFSKGSLFNALVKATPKITVDGRELTEEEVEIFSKSEGMFKVGGEWVATYDPWELSKLHETLEKLQKIDKVSLGKTMRILADVEGVADLRYIEAVQGPRLKRYLESLTAEKKNIKKDLSRSLAETLRPYQLKGVEWLWFLYNLNLGACLADDMGLGKTLQVLAYLTLIRKQMKNVKPKDRKPSLLVVPASLIANWISEIEKFTPELTYFVAHASQTGGKGHKKLEQFQNCDLVITTYGTYRTIKGIEEVEFNAVILDEAQAIKNPNSQITKKLRLVQSNHRVILTGTPVENKVLDLWSLFEFVNPGLLGARSRMSKHPIENIRELIGPFLLRRLKTDKDIIADLPDKIEVMHQCSLTRPQAVLYQKAVDTLAGKINELTHITRKGHILSTILRLKQICNHPSAIVSDTEWDMKASGKLQHLYHLVEEILENGEKVLIFSQYRETVNALTEFLGKHFKRNPLSIHGDISIKNRSKTVDLFQESPEHPYLVMSLKTGGTGLNLTAATHVIHFDRWWNPAVENQGTDRAHRIGQEKTVTVHKLLCSGTIEDRINELMEAKKKISNDLLEGDSIGSMITEMSNKEILDTLSLRNKHEYEL